MKIQPFIRNPYNYDVDEASDEAAIPADGHGESMTVQAMAEDADINVLMKKYGLLGKMPENPKVPSYGDYSEITDFRSALDAVAKAEEAFMEYPAEFRARWENNPQLFLDFVSNPVNGLEMQKMGLLKTPFVPATNPGTPGAPPATEKK